jgi:lipopolysaccharide export system ATP-binding protein
MIRELRSKGIGVFLSDHNVREALTVCDLAYIVNEGKVLEFGTPDEIVSSDLAKKYYLGEDFKL